MMTRWWFQRCFIFTTTWGSDPIWLICADWLKPPTRWGKGKQQGEGGSHQTRCDPGHDLLANFLHEVNIVFWGLYPYPNPQFRECLDVYKDEHYTWCYFVAFESIWFQNNQLRFKTNSTSVWFFSSDPWGIDSQFDLHILVKLGPSSHDVWIISSISFSFIFQCFP